jgi:hypothetical protein
MNRDEGRSECLAFREPSEDRHGFGTSPGFMPGVLIKPAT